MRSQFQEAKKVEKFGRGLLIKGLWHRSPAVGSIPSLSFLLLLNNPFTIP